MKPCDSVISLAESQVGYLYKKSNAQLDDFTANAGGKWNKYARDLDALGNFYNGAKNGYDGCDVFVDWLFVQTFGREIGQKMLYQPDRSLGAGTAYSLRYYQQKGRLFTTPQPADQIFFGDAKSTWHTGLVVKVEGGFVTTVEGNAGSPAAVRACKYALSYQYIKGYGRPDWSLAPTEPDKEEKDDMVIYKTINDIPQWYLSAVQKAVDKGALNGTGNGELNVSEDMCRVLTVLDRLGKLE